MKTFIFIIINFAIIFNLAYSQSGWINQNGVINSDLTSVVILDANNYITAGESDTILISSDAGVTWSKIVSPLNGIIDMDFVTDDVGFMTTDYDLMKTIDKGNNWTILQRHQLSSFRQSLDFLDESTGYISGSDDSPVAYVVKTTNGGSNWELYWMNDLGSANNIKFFDSDHGTALVCNRIHFTTNGGVNWSQRQSPFSCLNSIYSFNLNSYFVFSYLGKIYRTMNAGINWAEQISGTTKNILNSFFLDSTTGYAIGDSGLILRTSNGGVDWIIQNSNTLKKLSDIYFSDYYTGIIVGEDGTILKTTTGGLTFINSTSTNIPENFSLKQNYPNPFNPSTIINYDLPVTNNVSLKVYNNLGKEIATLVNEKQNAGSYTYQFSTVNYQLASGIYFYKLEAGEYSETRRMIFLK